MQSHWEPSTSAQSRLSYPSHPHPHHHTTSAAMPRNAPAKGRHISYNADGEICMTVVDPVTRKLLIPTQYIFETRAQQRGTLPSLCQLFLSGRCRQGQGCYQVHADWEAVQRLRSRVDSLPCCCPVHGDKDHLGVQENALLRESISLGHPHPHGHHHTVGQQAVADAAAAAESLLGANDVVLYVPGCSTFEGSYVPLDRVSYTVGLRRVLEEQRVVLAPACARVSLLDPLTGFAEDKVVADASAATVCRLHAMDRCRYAEECKFLHLCKDLTAADPQLTASPAAGGADAATAPTATAGPTTAGPIDCASRGSCDASTASAGLTTNTENSGTPADRRLKGASHGNGSLGNPNSVPRQSVFTSISLQQQHASLGQGSVGAAMPPPFHMGSASSLQQQSYSMSFHPEASAMMAATDASTGSAHDSSSRPYLMGASNSGAGPLLVPQRDEPQRCIDGSVIAAPATTGTAGHGSASGAGYARSFNASGRVGSTSSAPQRPQAVGSMGSYPGNTSSGCGYGSAGGNTGAAMPYAGHIGTAGAASTVASSAPYGYAPVCGGGNSNGGSRVRVSLSLPAVDSTPAMGFGAALGTSNSSDKTNSPPAEESLGVSVTSHNNGFSRSVTQLNASSTSAARWQHNPYVASWAKADAPAPAAAGPQQSYMGGSANSLGYHSANAYSHPLQRTA